MACRSVWSLKGANRHDMKLVRATLEGLVAARPAPSKAQPQGLCLDKGYDSPEVREIVQEFGFTAHIRPRGEEAKRSSATPGSRHGAGSWSGRIRG